mmetsp:Transcript_1794/g.2658  ORF Transcript_1794/g.2658 Transcript_1794/m.2658 type:complete len:477 (-) Transcript_1794:522-1952(-)
MRLLASQTGGVTTPIIALLFFACRNHVKAYQNAILSPRSCRPISESSSSVSATATSSHDIISPISNIPTLHRKRQRIRFPTHLNLSTANGDDLGGESEKKLFGTTPKISGKTPISTKMTTPPKAKRTYVNGDSSALMATSTSSDVGDELPQSDTLALILVPLALTLSFAGVVSLSGPGAWRYYVAGGICASVSHAITTPIDVVKTRQQVDPELEGKGIVKSTMKIVKRDGLGTLLVGLGPTTVGYLIEGSVKFGIYEVLKPLSRRFLSWCAAVTTFGQLDSRLLSLFICGTVSGFAASLMLCPMEALRIRLVAEPDFAPSGWVDGGLRMMKEDGILGLWNGMTSMMCKQVPYTVTKNVSFDFITSVAYNALKTWGVALTAHMKFYVPLCAAMATSVLSCISSQPGDLLLSLVSAHEKSKRTREFAKDIMKKDGPKGFFVGIRARFLHVGIIVTIQLLIYDFVKRLCGIAATGVGGH